MDDDDLPLSALFHKQTFSLQNDSPKSCNPVLKDSILPGLPIATKIDVKLLLKKSKLLLNPIPELEDDGLPDDDCDIFYVELLNTSPVLDEDDLPLSALLNKQIFSLQNESYKAHNPLSKDSSLPRLQAANKNDDELLLKKGLISKATYDIDTKKESPPRRESDCQFPQCEISPEHNVLIGTNCKMIMCILCGASFANVGYLKWHINSIHKKLRSFKCLCCDYSTERIRTLSNHILALHVKFKPFKCFLCDYSCSEEWNFLNHKMVAHKLEKPQLLLGHLPKMDDEDGLPGKKDEIEDGELLDSLLEIDADDLPLSALFNKQSISHQNGSHKACDPALKDSNSPSFPIGTKIDSKPLLKKRQLLLGPLPKMDDDGLPDKKDEIDDVELLDLSHEIDDDDLPLSALFALQNESHKAYHLALKDSISPRFPTATKNDAKPVRKRS